ncbi:MULTISPECIES: DUF4157 domain-containing protein [unclassified Rhizobium]|uniref:eCIS core domain-containing protein n=1 Tax=unclassified Rhizobium TaxID=2613769 RepID=UPI0018392AE1|nr:MULTISPECIES: DUF4157 domain-containing protein [unclassified Rhizobium]MBB3320517.1 hypothetical protein [Rhizobium sp. BK181]MBB3545465.1 hypothetical protein [Rhizobium sp. BK399]MCS3743182.1 hypothetical protein [Rhizobium sp. BK661]
MQRPFAPRHIFSTVLLGTIGAATSCVYACSGSPEFGPTGHFHAQAGANLKRDSSTIEVAIYGIARTLNEIQATTFSGPILESVLVASRDAAIKGSLPIPPDIRKQLTGYSTEASMNRVRYRIGDVGSFNLATVLERGRFADAVTLIDVVVFRDALTAATVSAWAHELIHVDQYHVWGVHGFAVRYAQNWLAVENPAYSKGDDFARWRCRKQAQDRQN